MSSAPSSPPTPPRWAYTILITPEPGSLIERLAWDLHMLSASDLGLVHQLRAAIVPGAGGSPAQAAGGPRDSDSEESNDSDLPDSDLDSDDESSVSCPASIASTMVDHSVPESSSLSKIEHWYAEHVGKIHEGIRQGFYTIVKAPTQAEIRKQPVTAREVQDPLSRQCYVIKIIHKQPYSRLSGSTGSKIITQIHTSNYTALVVTEPAVSSVGPSNRPGLALMKNEDTFRIGCTYGWPSIHQPFVLDLHLRFGIAFAVSPGLREAKFDGVLGLSPKRAQDTFSAAMYKQWAEAIPPADGQHSGLIFYFALRRDTAIQSVLAYNRWPYIEAESEDDPVEKTPDWTPRIPVEGKRGWVTRIVSLGFEKYDPDSKEWKAVPDSMYTFDRADGVRVMLDTGASLSYMPTSLIEHIIHVFTATRDNSTPVRVVPAHPKAPAASTVASGESDTQGDSADEPSTSGDSTAVQLGILASDALIPRTVRTQPPDAKLPSTEPTTTAEPTTIAEPTTTVPPKQASSSINVYQAFGLQGKEGNWRVVLGFNDWRWRKTTVEVKAPLDPFVWASLPKNPSVFELAISDAYKPPAGETDPVFVLGLNFFHAMFVALHNPHPDQPKDAYVRLAPQWPGEVSDYSLRPSDPEWP
ncbi:hypothetical protein C8Q77DRAFT_1072783 [Trametes polyzona]|nr:hypothetical protein C8Q77DRAFT_1072783 [Trametes polyzona]